jgi:hypothetical protein
MRGPCKLIEENRAAWREVRSHVRQDDRPKRPPPSWPYTSARKALLATDGGGCPASAVSDVAGIMADAELRADRARPRAA